MDGTGKYYMEWGNPDSLLGGQYWGQTLKQRWEQRMAVKQGATTV